MGEPLSQQMRRANEGFEEKIASCTVGFCLTRQASTSPIVCLNQLSKFVRTIQIYQ